MVGLGYYWLPHKLGHSAPMNKYNRVGLKIILDKSGLGDVVDVVELPPEVALPSDGLLHHLVEFPNIFVHEIGGVVVQGLLDIGSLDVFQQVQQAHGDLVEFVDGFPARLEDGETDAAVLVDVGMQNFVEASDLWRFVGVLLSGPEGESDHRVAVEGPLFVGDDLDDEFGDAALFGEADDDVLDGVLVVLLDVNLHALLGCLEIGTVVALNLLLRLHSDLLEVFKHYIRFKRGTSHLTLSRTIISDGLYETEFNTRVLRIALIVGQIK